MKIILADDHKIIRDGLRSLLDKQPGMEVVAEAMDGQTTVQLAMELLPDVIIMDIGMPGMSGIEATQNIITENPGIKVIVLSMHSDKRFVAEMFKAGAVGYLPKDCAFEELFVAIKAVVENKFYLSPVVTGVVLKDYIHKLKNNDSSVYSILTVREREVLKLIADGKTTSQMAVLLIVSEKTIETHRRQLMSKLDIYSIAELTKYAIREGLTSFEA